MARTYGGGTLIRIPVYLRPGSHDDLLAVLNPLLPIHEAGTELRRLAILGLSVTNGGIVVPTRTIVPAQSISPRQVIECADPAKDDDSDLVMSRLMSQFKF